MKRTQTAELLDTDAGTPAEVASSLADLRRINRWFGGVSTTQELLARVFAQLQTRSLTLLEVAAGAGYVPQVVKQRLEQRGLGLELTMLDRSASHLPHAVEEVAGDALALPFRDNAFDLVDCSLFAHHLSAADLPRFMSEALRVCRHAVLINDLVRHRLHLLLVYAGMPLYFNRITRHDAVASVRQAYTVEEMRELLSHTRSARIEIFRHYLFRMGVLAWKHQPPAKT